MKQFLVSLLVLALVGVAAAEDQLLLTATNDQDQNVDKLLLRLNKKGEPTHLVHRRTGKDTSAYTPVELSKGVVLRRQMGKDLLLLKTTQFNPSNGAAVVMNYLYSGLPPEQYKNLRFDLKRRNGKWFLFKDGAKKPLRKLHFMANMGTVFGIPQAVGIRQIKLLH